MMRHMQIKITMRHHFTAITMAIIHPVSPSKKTQRINMGKDVEKFELSHIAGGK